MLKKIIITSSIVFVSQYGFCAISPNDAVKACLGEAEGESMTGKIAMMEALRNRNTLTGVYGHKAIKIINGEYYRITPRKRKLSNITVKACQSAWVDSAHTNYVKGADHWEAVQTFGRPKWSKNMIQTVKIGNHTFFKDR